ncbi:uncharacterized protein LOC133722414 [Rosa rugosa]|uniref:uncharacterized protein LOC133722414 n=1 Tax=Rosa rugosa TaxID=74645 RepID=UPI002B40AFD1|nr:uncharacterized protein LOC133722414 [Rosa rugosa]XP_062005297.1 uncharacterized protein LOC133722414 [Rosa rugosa]XP_062005298.1 uncharacterized protein LOC133722414 [Rosa rugosa]XP_062005299.1 uncharacterized protein LOC133722414 [Rosa rugosa]XP_062005300.1 uncharacterized protein LOC133722414 [Rosa rugosa]
MWRDKPPGLKILWVWTLGTAAVLVANVVRTRMRDMDTLMNNTEQHHHQQQQAAAADTETLLLPESDQVIREEKSS